MATAKNRAGLFADILSKLPTNGTENITASLLRSVVDDMVQSDFNLTDDLSLLSSLTEYTASKSYVVDEVTIYQGVFYQCVTATTGAFNATNWVEVPTDSSIFTFAAWDNLTTYALNNVIRYNLKLYKSLSGGNQGNQPDTTPLSWVEISSSASFVIPDWSPGFYNEGAPVIYLNNLYTRDVTGNTESIDIAAEIIAGDWQIIGGSTTGLSGLTLNVIPKSVLAGDDLVDGSIFDDGLSVVIGGTTSDASAELVLQSTTKGLILNRVTTIQRDAILSPLNSLIVFNTGTNQFEYNSGTPGTPVWLAIGGSGTPNLSTVLSTGNSTGGSNIDISTGQSLIFNNSSFKATLIESILSSDILLTLPSITGTLALTSQIIAPDGNGIYDGNGIAPSTTVVTLTDTINFLGGNFGIGAAPISRLQVRGAGTTSATSTFLLEDSTGADLFNILDNGRLGMGISPGGGFTWRFFDTSQNNGMDIRLTSTDVNAGSALTVTNNGTTAPSNIALSLSASNGTSGSNVALRVQAGDVRISDLASKMSLNSSINSAARLYVLLANPNTATAGFWSSVVKTSGVNYGMRTDAQGVGATTNIGIQASGRNATNNYAIVTPSNGGNIGLGTLSPTARLHVRGVGTTSATDALIVQDSLGVDLLSVQDGGNISIGSLAPSARLHVKGADDLAGTLAFLVENNSGNGILKVQNNGVVVIEEFTIATLPTAVAGGMIAITDEVGGYTLAFGDGVNWRNAHDRAISV